MRKCIGRILHWMTRERYDLGGVIFKITGDVKRILEKDKSSSVQKTKPVVVQSDLQIPKRQRNNGEKPIPNTSNPDRIFQIGIVGLGICVIGLILSGVTYLIIIWAMR